MPIDSARRELVCQYLLRPEVHAALAGPLSRIPRAQRPTETERGDFGRGTCRFASHLVGIAVDSVDFSLPFSVGLTNGRNIAFVDIAISYVVHWRFAGEKLPVLAWVDAQSEQATNIFTQQNGQRWKNLPCDLPRHEQCIQGLFEGKPYEAHRAWTDSLLAEGTSEEHRVAWCFVCDDSLGETLRDAIQCEDPRDARVGWPRWCACGIQGATLILSETPRTASEAAMLRAHGAEHVLLGPAFRAWAAAQTQTFEKNPDEVVL